MILEIVTGTAMSGLLTWTFLDKHSVSTDASKIQRVANNCGLHVKEEGKLRTIHLMRRTRHPWGTEYVYRIPLGLSFEDIHKKKQHIEDGLNHKRGFLDLSLDEIRSIRLNGDILQQIKKLLNGTKHRKEILMNYDGALKIRVYKEPLTDKVPFDNDTLSKCDGWNIYVGTSREGDVYHDFDTIPHLIVAGTTRFGKSVFLKNVITTFIHTQSNAVKFTLLDLKGGLAFQRYKNASQVETVAKDVVESLEALQTIQADMVKRQEEFLESGFEDIREAKMKQRHFIVIDEAAELASQGEPDPSRKKKKIECEHIISEIARIGAGLGYRLVFCTQYPTSDTLPRQVKQNANAKVCFLLDTEIASRVVLDESGAESLPHIKGRAIYRTDMKQIVQTPFIENDFIDKTIKPHIVIRPRKEQQHDSPKETPAGRGYSLIIKET